MKKLLAIIALLLMLTTTATTATAEISMWYDSSQTWYVICAYDEQYKACYTAFVDSVELLSKILANEVCSAYYIDVDGLAELDWTVTDSQVTVWISHMPDEPICTLNYRF